VGIDRNANAHEFNYDDDDGNNDDNDEDEEKIFLQDDTPVSRSRRYRKNPDSDDRSANNGASERNYTLIEMLSTSSAWLMAWTCVILVGGGTVMTNNIGQMTEALGFDADLTPASIALFSAAQAASRVITGAVSEAALSWKLPWFCGYLASSDGKGLARPAFLVVASIVSAAAHFSLAVATTEEGFALAVTLSGIAFGMVWPLMVLITGEVFGTRHVGANYMFFDGFSSAAGTLLLSKFVAQTVYDDHINEGHGDPNVTPASDSEFKCFGTECFRLSHVIVSLLSLTCILSSVGLIWTTRNVYRRS
jgi:MFS family permease